MTADVFIGPCLINGTEPYIKELIRVARITLDGSTCVVPLSELQAMLGDGQTYEVQVTSMRKAEFDRLPEFTGF
jgi:hypothetical protein